MCQKLWHIAARVNCDRCFAPRCHRVRRRAQQRQSTLARCSLRRRAWLAFHYNNFHSCFLFVTSFPIKLKFEFLVLVVLSLLIYVPLIPKTTPGLTSHSIRRETFFGLRVTVSITQAIPGCSSVISELNSTGNISTSDRHSA